MWGDWRNIVRVVATLAVTFGAPVAFAQEDSKSAQEESKGSESSASGAKTNISAGQPSEPERPRALRVGYAGAPPFVTVGDNGAPEGLSIRVWRDLAERIETEYELER